MIKCKKCNGQETIKKGQYKTARGLVRRYKCKACNATFSLRTDTKNYRMRKQHLQKKITELYCERMSLNGISRVLKVNIKTVTKYFLKASNEAKVKNLKALKGRAIVTSYIQFDELETFEHTRKKPLGVFLFVRAKTGEIINATVSKSPIRALTVSPKILKSWNAQVNKQQPLVEGLLDCKKVANRVTTTIACDGQRQQVALTKKICDNEPINVQVLESKNKKIDLAIRKLRNDVSRLGRKTICTTKKQSRLQNHLDLYINYSNTHRVMTKAI